MSKRNHGPWRFLGPREAASTRAAREPKGGLADEVIPAVDDGPGDWLQPRLRASPQGTTLVASVVPTGFEAYARVFHPAQSAARRGGTSLSVPWSAVAGWSGSTAHPEMQWEAISKSRRIATTEKPWDEDPDVGQMPIETRAAMAGVLAPWTSTPDHSWVCIWEGFAGIPEFLANVPRVQLPHRSYVLLHATVKRVGDGPLLVGPLHDLGPNLWWPEDRSWCVATEIDFRWTYVGGSAECIQAVLAHQRLEALPANPSQRADSLGDRINATGGPR
jgi:hypothetical protein